MYKIVFYVPESHLESVKAAAFKAGAGKFPHYDHCCWQILGQGQFRPKKGSDPFIGQEDTLSIVPEYRVESICEDGMLETVIKAILAAHPYEEPAYEAWPLSYPMK
ncbi:MAG: NGG1p interacting factor [Gammaproteobacteria bacterium]|jgi:hypothetical protein|nr:NGG1p interacting factor [Gammaproteobacteria bacterium]